MSLWYNPFDQTFLDNMFLNVKHGDIFIVFCNVPER